VIGSAPSNWFEGRLVPQGMNDESAKKRLARNAEVYQAMRSRFSGVDIVPQVVRLCAMPLYLHDIAGADSLIEARDALLGAAEIVENLETAMERFRRVANALGRS
jgi:type I restriction-modification system DNA methylase subunit